MDENTKKIIEMEQAIKNIVYRLEQAEKNVADIKDLTLSIKELAIETKANRQDINKIDTRLEDIEKKPSQNWDKIITTGIGTIVGAIAGAIISLIIK